MDTTPHHASQHNTSAHDISELPTSELQGNEHRISGTVRLRHLGAAAIAALLTAAAVLAADDADDRNTVDASGVSDVVGAAPDPGVVIVDVTPSQRVAVETAIDWYEEMGLELPPITVRGGDRETLCKGHAGLYVWQGDDAEVRICTTGGSWEQRVVLHELAHAWAYANVPAERREAFVALRGLESWHDEDDAWDRRGDEHAAEIIAWGVSEIPFPIVRIDDRSCTALRAGYVTLTGREPRQTEQQLCRPVAASPAR